MTQDEWDKAEEFMEGYMLDLTYDIITGKIKLTDLIESEDEIILSYDPFESNGDIDQVWLLQDLIEYYIESEQYERCAKLLKMKLQVEKGALDLTSRLILSDSDFATPSEKDSVQVLIDDLLNNKHNNN